MTPISLEQKRCERILNLLDSYLSNELLIETNHEVLRHLESCRTCSAALQNRTRVKSALQRAVSSEIPDPELKARLQSRLRSVQPGTVKRTWHPWPMAVAATLLLMLGSYAVMRNHIGVQDDARFTQQAMQVLKIGLGDHVKCAINHRFAEASLTDEKMTALLGEGYSGIASELKAQAPAGYRLTAAHKCKVDGRQFAHLILKNPDGFVSVIVTRKQGETYPAKVSLRTFESFGIKLHQAQLEGFQVAGFETNQHLGFFVSGLAPQENFQIASRLAPALGQYLRKLEL